MNKEKVDFLFIYEIKPREIESICLLGYELKRRGYTVAYVNTWKNLDRVFMKRLDAEVVIGFAAYDTPTVDFVLSYAGEIRKMVNMQWEQLLSIGQKDDKATDYYIKGKAEKIVHFSWGEDNYKRLTVDCGIDERNVKTVGHVGLDFFRKEFMGYYKSKREICEQFHFENDKRICLFISSFSYVNIPEIYVDYVGDSFVQISNESQRIVLEWIERILEVRNDITFIYRPHPAEASNESLLNITKKYPNFRVLSQYSVKQWIAIADVIYNWYSTSLMEIYCSGKSCYLLRPIKMPRRYEIAIFENAEFVEDYDTFSKTIDQKGVFPVSDIELKKFYYIDKSEAAYKKVVNELEKIYKEDGFVLPHDFKERQRIGKKRFVMRLWIVRICIYLFTQIRSLCGVKEAAEKLHFSRYAKQLKKQNYASKREIKAIMQKISIILGENICEEEE